MEFLAHLVVTALLLLLVARIVPGVEVRSGGAALLGALVLGLVNGLVRPVAVILTLPITILTLGLFWFVLNALMFWLASALVPGIRIEGFAAALLGSLALSALNVAVALVFGL